LPNNDTTERNVFDTVLLSSFGIGTCVTKTIGFVSPAVPVGPLANAVKGIATHPSPANNHPKAIKRERFAPAIIPRPANNPRNTFINFAKATQVPD
jgi:hypothetical protein